MSLAHRATLDLLAMLDNLVTEELKDDRDWPDGLVQRDCLGKLATWGSQDLQARKASKDHRVTLVSRDQLGLLDKSVHLEHRDHLEVLVRRVLMEALDSLVLPV